MTDIITDPITDEVPEVPVSEPEQPVEEPDRFDREYVTKLRAEAAESRTALKEAATRGDELFESLKFRTAQQAAAGILQDVTDMPADDPRYYDDNGFPSVDGMREVAEELARAKPYLARPRGDVSQGARPVTDTSTFGDLIRGALR